MFDRRRTVVRTVLSASDACLKTLIPFVDRDWRYVRPRDPNWSVWTTVIHVNDDRCFYAPQALLADESEYSQPAIRGSAMATPGPAVTRSPLAKRRRRAAAAGARDVEHIDPEQALADQLVLDLPGWADYMKALLWDYQNNPPRYPDWRACLRRRQPKLVAA